MPNLTLKHAELYSRRFARYVEQTGFGRAHALGALLFFWDETRSQSLTHADKPTLLGHMDGGADAKLALFDALVSAGYLIAQGEQFEICGNADALAFTQQRRAVARMATRKKPAKKTRKIHTPKAAVPVPVADAAPAAAPARSPVEAACHATWLAYAQAYEARTTRLPVRNQKVNSQIKQLVARVGADIAPALARFYVTQAQDAYYVNNFWPLGALLVRAEGFVTQMQLGRAVSQKDAQSLSSSADYYRRRQQLRDRAAGLECKDAIG
jgi:hypothetical protein